MRYRPLKWLVYTVIIALTACKKDHDVITPSPKPILSVSLTLSYLDAQKIDSAFAIWRIGGQEQRMKMLLRNDSLLTDMNTFIEGAGDLTIHLFTGKKFRNQYASQWILKKDLTIRKNKALSYKGPSSFLDSDWFARVELTDAVGHQALVGLRPEDAYFSVQKPPHDLYRLTVSKGYSKGINIIGEGVWTSDSSCFDGKDSMENNTSFAFLPGRIGTTAWSHISVVVLYEINHNGEGWVLSLEHDL